MILTYWTMMQIQQLLKDSEKYQIPQDVQNLSVNTLGILDDNYGIGRSLEDDGGCVIILIPDFKTDIDQAYHKILEHYRIGKECVEFEDFVCSTEEKVWQADLYILGNDYGITIVYPIDGGSV